MVTPEDFTIPEKCPKCNSTEFTTLSNGDVICKKCKTIVGRIYDYFSYDYLSHEQEH